MAGVSRRTGKLQFGSNRSFIGVGGHILMKIYVWTNLNAHFHVDTVHVPPLRGAGKQAGVLKYTEI